MTGTQEAVLELQGVSKKFGRNSVLKSVDLSVLPKEVVGLVGPNGAGKTTLLRIVVGFLLPDGGTVKHASPTGRSNNDAITIGYLPERAPLYDASKVERYLRFIATLKNIPSDGILEQVNKVVAAFGLVSVRHSVIGNLSKGYRQRLGLAQAFLGDSDLLVLDEPMNGLDPFQLVDIRAMILEAANDRAILFSSHVMQEIETICSRSVFLDDGILVNIKEEGLDSRVEVLVRTSRINVLRQGLESAVPNCILEEEQVNGLVYRLVLSLRPLEKPQISRILTSGGELFSFQELETSLEARLRAMRKEAR